MAKDSSKGGNPNLPVATGSPIIRDPEACSYLSAYRAAKELLHHACELRHRVECRIPDTAELKEAIDQLRLDVQNLVIALEPFFRDGIPFDPLDQPDWVGQPNVICGDIASKLAAAHGIDGFSASGFNGRSAHDVVSQLGFATLRGMENLAASSDIFPLNACDDPRPPLRVLNQLGPITANEEEALRHACFQEANAAWQTEKARLAAENLAQQDTAGSTGAAGGEPAESSNGNQNSTSDGQIAVKSLLDLRPAVRKAYLAYEYAESKVGKRLEDREAYDWLKEHGIDQDAGNLGELTDYELPPAFDTWSRYVRRARKALGENKHTRRAGRTGRSIVRQDGL